MPDPWRCLSGARPEHGYDAQVLHSVLGPKDANGNSEAEKEKWNSRRGQRQCDVVEGDAAKQNGRGPQSSG